MDQLQKGKPLNHINRQDYPQLSDSDVTFVEDSLYEKKKLFIINILIVIFRAQDIHLSKRELHFHTTVATINIKCEKPFYKILHINRTFFKNLDTQNRVEKSVN